MWWDGRSQDTSPPEVSGCCGQPWWFSQGYNVTIQIWCYDHSPHFTLLTGTLTSVGWKLSNLMVDGKNWYKCQMLKSRLTPSLMFRSSLQSLWHDSHLDAPVSSWGGCWLSWWSPTAVVPSRGMSQVTVRSWSTLEQCCNHLDPETGPALELFERWPNVPRVWSPSTSCADICLRIN